MVTPSRSTFLDLLQSVTGDICTSLTPAPIYTDRYPTAAETSNFDAYSVDQFCRRHSISVAMFYKMRAQGLTPVEFKVGTRTLISRESAAAWRAERELTTRGARQQPETKVAE